MEINTLLQEFTPARIGEQLLEELLESELQRGCIPDTKIFSICLSSDARRKLLGKGPDGLYLASFVARHAVACFAWHCEQLNRGSVSLSMPFEDLSPFAVLRANSQAFLAQHARQFLGVRISLSARGLEWKAIPLTECGFFDVYQNEQVPTSSRTSVSGSGSVPTTGSGSAHCLLPPHTLGGYCALHANACWPSTEQSLHGEESPYEEQSLHAMHSLALTSIDQEVLRHRTMMNFYINFANIGAYSKEELDQLLRKFWAHVINSQSLKIGLETAAKNLGFHNIEEFRRCDAAELRRRYKAALFQHHPDRGGDVQNFHRAQISFAELLAAMHKETN